VKDLTVARKKVLTINVLSRTNFLSDVWEHLMLGCQNITLAKYWSEPGCHNL